MRIIASILPRCLNHTSFPTLLGSFLKIIRNLKLIQIRRLSLLNLPSLPTPHTLLPNILPSLLLLPQVSLFLPQSLQFGKHQIITYSYISLTEIPELHAFPRPSSSYNHPSTQERE